MTLPARRRHFRCKKIEQFQHYHSRNPPWIKLHQSVTEDTDFALLPDAAKGHLVLIWLIASRLENKLPFDAAFIGARINAREPVDLDLLLSHGFIELFDDASAALADRKQDASAALERAEQSREPEQRAAAAAAARAGARVGHVPHDPRNRLHVELVERLEAAAPLVAQTGDARDHSIPRTPLELLARLSRTKRGAVITDLRRASPAWINRTAVALTSLERELFSRYPQGMAAASHDVDPRAASSWELVLAGLERALGRQSYATWFRPTSGLMYAGEELLVAVPNEQFQRWLESNYAEVVADAVKAAGLTCRVRFLVAHAAAS